MDEGVALDSQLLRNAWWRVRSYHHCPYFNAAAERMVGPVGLEPTTNRLWGWGRVRRDSDKRKHRKVFFWVLISDLPKSEPMPNRRALWVPMKPC